MSDQVTGGALVTCVNNIDSGSAAMRVDDGRALPLPAVKPYQPLSWYLLALELLKGEGTKDLTPYGADFLSYSLGGQVKKLKRNEIEYQWALDKAVSALEYAVDRHALRETYQITLPAYLALQL